MRISDNADDYLDYTPIPERRMPWWWWLAYSLVMLGGFWILYRAFAGWPGTGGLLAKIVG